MFDKELDARMQTSSKRVGTEPFLYRKKVLNDTSLTTPIHISYTAYEAC